jgi:hypothetical protein
MVSRIMDRRALREQADQAERSEASVEQTTVVDVPPRKGRKAKAPATPKVRKVRAKKLPPRMRALWGVFDATMKRVAIFDYNQRAAAAGKLADLIAQKKTIHYLQIVKEEMSEPALVESLPVA